MTLRPAVLRRLFRELAQLQNDPPEGIRVVTAEDDMLDVTGIIEGPAGTPYEGGYFKVKFSFTEEFPAAPPKCRFATKIFHPNVSTAGEICVNTLKKDWQSSYGIGHILVTVKCLLIYPNPESALDEEAGKILLENYEDYCARARLITSVHATPKVRPPEFDTPSSSTSSSTPHVSSHRTANSNTASVDSVPNSKIQKVFEISSEIPEPVNHSSLSTPSPRSTVFSRKSPSPAPQLQPLQTSGSMTNTLSTHAISILPYPDKDREKDKEDTSVEKELVREKSPLSPPLPTTIPLGCADANAPTVGKVVSVGDMSAPTKAVKRPATIGTGGVINEKRKKALKRL